jgi:glycosyltransferase involved in cell wall biosynthesis
MTFSLVLAGLVLLYWLSMFVIHLRGLRFVPRLARQEQPLQEEPLVSIIVAAKEEEASIANTLRTILQQEYRHFEIIAVNDRSVDATGLRMEEVKREAEAAGRQVRFEVLQISELPSGWLGKNNALYQGYLQARGDYILFTDADIEYKPQTLRSAMAYFLQMGLDHLTVAPLMLANSFWLRGFVHFFLFALCMYKWPWRPNDDRQHRDGFGIGAFNFISRSAYETIGTHRKLAMRPDDDLQLGNMVKRAHLKQRFLTGPQLLSVEWYPSLRVAVRGLEKNMFAGLNYSLVMVVMAVIGQFLFFCFPFFGVWLFGGWIAVMYGVSVLVMMALYLLYTRKMSTDPGYEVIALPLVVLIFIYILIRSSFLTLKQGGINWRGTFYSLEDLKKMNQKDTYIEHNPLE